MSLKMQYLNPNKHFRNANKMSIVRYPAEQGLDISRLTEPLVFHFSNRAMPNRIFKAAMGEALGKWDPVDIPTSGIPSEELIELYRRYDILLQVFQQANKSDGVR